MPKKTAAPKKSEATLDMLRKRLKDGFYETARGAKRAMTRAINEKKMSAEDGKKVAAAIKRTFG